MRKYLTVALLSIIILIGFLFLNKASSAGFVTQQMSDSLVSFVTIFDIKAATKDGYYLNGYVVPIDYKRAQRIAGKKIRVSGVVTVVKGLSNEPVEYDKEGNKIIKQGRELDTKHILNPTIEVLD